MGRAGCEQLVRRCEGCGGEVKPPYTRAIKWLPHGRMKVFLFCDDCNAALTKWKKKNPAGCEVKRID